MRAICCEKQSPEQAESMQPYLISVSLGLFGCAIVLTCYAGIAREAAFRASAMMRGSFERNVIVGTGVLVAGQALLIVAGVLNLVPLTGITLPLLSRGGSSMVATLIALGIMLGASCGRKAATFAESTRTQATAAKARQDSVCTGRVYGPIDARAPHNSVVSRTNVTAPRAFALALSTGLALCLAGTVAIQHEHGEIALCGTTQHESARGRLLTTDGVVLACDANLQTTTKSGQGSTRSYPEGRLACHVLGAASDGIEAREALTGSNTVANLLALPEQGSDVVLSLDSRIQRAAEQQLSDATGAIVVLDAQTGRVLAMASSPTYDLTGDIDEATQSCLNRATAARYSPGSTFKLVTLAAALEKGSITAESLFDAPSSLAFGGNARVTNFESNAFGKLSAAQATNLSANTVFAQIGNDLGGATLMKSAEAFGFNGRPDFEIGLQTSSIGKLSNSFEVAWAACGQAQGEAILAATPLQMALVMCAVANDGSIMQPYLVHHRVNPQGNVIAERELSVLAKPISANTAAQMRDILKLNDAASAWCPYSLYGKTGTVENEGAADHAWYVGCVEDGEHQIVVCCIVEHGGTGAAAALPRAAVVATAAIEAL